MVVWGVSQNELNLHNAQWSSPTNFNCVPPKQKLSALREALWDRAFFVGLRLNRRSCISSISFFFWAVVKQCSVEETNKLSGLLFGAPAAIEPPTYPVCL